MVLAGQYEFYELVQVVKSLLACMVEDTVVNNRFFRFNDRSLTATGGLG